MIRNCNNCAELNSCYSKSTGRETAHGKTQDPALVTHPRKHNHYFKPVEGLSHIDVYRVLTLFGVTDPCLQHALKKILVAGGRGHKDIGKDVQEAIDTLERWKEMRAEEQT